MNVLTAVRVGLKRGWHEQVLSLRSSQDQGFYVFMALVTVGYMFWQRNNVIEEIGLSVPQIILPTVIAVVIAFGIVVGPAYQIAMEREDGTVLRLKTAPGGIVAYSVGQVVLHITSVVPTLVIIVVPAALLFDAGSQRGLAGWLAASFFILVGMLALLPIGIIIGSLVPDVRRAGMWGMLPLGAMIALSGIFFPLANLWPWLQAIGQGLPLYWFGHSMRYALLPDGASVMEHGGEWNILAAVLVMLAWAVVASVVAVFLLRRVARGQTGASVLESRDAAAQWVR